MAKSDETSVALTALGRGFSILPQPQNVNFRAIDESLTEILLEPRKELLSPPEPGDGYSGYIRDVTRHYQFHRKLGASFQTNISAVVPVKIEAENGYTVTLEENLKYCVQQIHTRTIRFKPKVIRSMPRILSVTGCHSSSSTQTTQDLEPVMQSAKKANELYESLIQNETTLGDSLEDGEKWKKLLDRKPLSGATHFVSAVYLGAKVIEIRKGSSETVNDKWERLLGDFYAAGGSLQRSELMSEELDEPLFHKEVKHLDIDFKGEWTRIEETQELVIGYELSPITLLVPENRRCDFESVCMEQLRDKRGYSPNISGKGNEGPFLLVTNTLWLRVDGDRVMATKDKNAASPFHILSQSDGRFCIEYKSEASSKEMYVSLCKEGEATLMDQPEGRKTLFQLVRARDGSRVHHLSEWSTEPLEIQRVRRFFQKPTIYLCVLPEADEQNRHHVTSSLSSDALSSPMTCTQFYIRTPIQ
jgi:hypothetical protein